MRYSNRSEWRRALQGGCTGILPYAPGAPKLVPTLAPRFMSKPVMCTSNAPLLSCPDLVWSQLDQGAAHVSAGAFESYFRLKDLLRRTDSSSRARFRKEFTTYYRLNAAGLSDEFKTRFFELLFAFDSRGAIDPYTSLLLELHTIPRRVGDHALQASFVTKLVAIHDEARPIYDRHVSRFFGISVPSVGSVEFRVAGFVTNLRFIQTQYEAWSLDSRFPALQRQLVSKQPLIEQCKPARVFDFLVWTVGSQRLV